MKTIIICKSIVKKEHGYKPATLLSPCDTGVYRLLNGYFPPMVHIVSLLSFLCAPFFYLRNSS